MNELFNDQCQATRIPSLDKNGYWRARDQFEQEVTFKTLVAMGYDTEEATELARSTDGSARQRLKTIGVIG